MLTHAEALFKLHDIIRKAPKGVEVLEVMDSLDKLAPGLGQLYFDYLMTNGKPTWFIPKATEMIVANSSKLGRILR